MSCKTCDDAKTVKANFCPQCGKVLTEDEGIIMHFLVNCTKSALKLCEKLKEKEE